MWKEWKWTIVVQAEVWHCQKEDERDNHKTKWMWNWQREDQRYGILVF